MDATLPIVSFEHAVIARAGVALINDFSVGAGAGELIGIIGPNGSGKSSLLLTILGEIPLAGGSMTFPASGNRPRIAFIPQADAIDPLVPFSVHELLLAAGYRGTRPTIAARNGALAAVGLPGTGKRLFSRLSGGERQRVLLARASLVGAPLWLFDEPTAAIDQKGEALLLDFVRTLVWDRGVAALFVSHHLQAVRSRADVVIELEGGTARVVNREPAESRE